MNTILKKIKIKPITGEKSRSLFKKKLLLIISILIINNSCNYLDIVPDNIATVDNAFRLRNQAEKYLFTCYSYLPNYGNMFNDPALLSGDEIWFYYPYQNTPINFKPPVNWEVARGNLNVLDPYLNYWDGEDGGTSMFQGIRDCNIFLENIDKVPDMTPAEKNRWKSEVSFLKAYYHWVLIRLYGPIPIIDENLPVSSGIDEVQVKREKTDHCFDYVVELIDKSIAHLPEFIEDPISEMGRITQPIAMSIKARILVTAASPLFNGNADIQHFVDDSGEPFINATYDPSKWEKAAKACKEAIDICHANANKLYEFQPLVDVFGVGPRLRTQMNIRNSVCEKWNSEIIWGATNSLANEIQAQSQAIVDPEVGVAGNKGDGAHAQYAPPLKIAEMFYTENGVPINEDKSYNYEERYDLMKAEAEDSVYLFPGYETVYLHFDREPRFYASLGFDGGVWYGQGKFNQADLWHLEGRLGGYSGKSRGDQYSVTGYYAKKLVNFLNVIQPNASYQVRSYPWPIMRLADLYLYYAEALNEANGPSAEVYVWIDAVRERAGLNTVEQSWTNWSNNPTKHLSKEGLRDIIHQERLIEMVFEGNRFWDLRRWKKAHTVLNQSIVGWDIEQEDPVFYYQPKVLFNQNFQQKDYFWPIKENNLIVNKNLVQNPGW